MADENTFTSSTGNVFADMDLPDADELPIKSHLVLHLKRVMKEHGLTQREVARRVGADQPTISKVLRGRLDLVTTDRLLAWHKNLDQDVHLTIRDNFGRSGGGAGADCQACI